MTNMGFDGVAGTVIRAIDPLTEIALRENQHRRAHGVTAWPFREGGIT